MSLAAIATQHLGQSCHEFEMALMEGAASDPVQRHLCQGLVFMGVGQRMALTEIMNALASIQTQLDAIRQRLDGQRSPLAPRAL
jgi:hypothetical protein